MLETAHVIPQCKHCPCFKAHSSIAIPGQPAAQHKPGEGLCLAMPPSVHPVAAGPQGVQLMNARPTVHADQMGCAIPSLLALGFAGIKGLEDLINLSAEPQDASEDDLEQISAELDDRVVE